MQTTNTIDGNSISVIRLLDQSGTTLLDSISAEYEDSFCIESFGELIRQAANAEPKGTKRFIIARVQTWDSKQPDRTFYSYYHAHHLNKLLFQTQYYLDMRLIHRLRVLNPLTNTDIIGNVLYFVVTGRSFTRLQSQSSPVREASILRLPDSGKDMKSPGVPLAPTGEQVDQISANIEIHCLPTEKPTSFASSPITASPFNKKGGRHRAATLSSQVNNKVVGWTLAQPVVKVDNDPSVQFIKTGDSTQSSPGAQEDDSAPLLSNKQPTSPLEPQKLEPGQQLRKLKRPQNIPKLKISTQVVQPAPSLLQSPVIKTPVPAGVLSQMGNPTSLPTPASERGRRRPLSYMNSLITAGDKEATMDDWEELLKQDQVSGGSSEDADKVKPFRSLAMKQRQLNPTSAKQQVTYYDAVLIATDSDFLESRRCRQFFHENAVFEDDAVLMEMKAVTQQDLDNQQNALRSPERHWWTIELDDDIRKWSWMTWLKIILVNLVVTSIVAGSVLLIVKAATRT